MLSVDELLYFREVAEARNISMAADRLGITQPSLSLAIKRLEAAVGTNLLIRSRSGVELTKVGRKLADKSHVILQQWENLRAEILDDEREIQGHFTLGCHPSVALYSAPLFMQCLLEEAPGLTLSLVHEHSRDITQRVIDYEIDFGIVVNPYRHADLTIIHLAHDVVRLWRAEAPHMLQDVENPEGVIIYDPGLNQATNILKEAQSDHLLKCQRRLFCSSLEVIADLTSQGAGLGVIPSRVVHKLQPQLQPIEDFPTYSDELCFIYRKDYNSSPAATFLKDTIVTRLKEAWS